jgi:transposase
MLPISSLSRFYLYTRPCDMRKSFDGLCGIIRDEFNQEPQSGHVYLFINRRRDRIKLLVWDRSGFWLLYKRLEEGTFQAKVYADQTSAVSISYEHLLMLLEGLEASQIKLKKRYKRA